MTRRTFLSRFARLGRAALALSLAVSGPTAALHFAARPAAAATADPFINTAWQLTLVPDSSTRDNGHDSFDEFLFFDSNGLTAKMCACLGFPATAYTTTAGPLGTGFSCSATSNTQGSMVWSGTLTGGQITGTLTWSRGDDVASYTFTATPFNP